MDHRDIGNNLQLYFFDDSSPGSCFFKPHGTIIYNGLTDFIRYYYKQLGYQEVITPIIYNNKLWEISGHLDKYRENMFMIDKESLGKGINEYSLKPMNCPGHCIMFKHDVISQRDLPLRYADFGDLHRNEISGALSGLTRVRRFKQDDAHIFCTFEQIEEEIGKCLVFQKNVYDHFGFKFSVELSTRPEKYIGELDNWNKAEEILHKIIKRFKNWSINPGDGAFYGPKLDIKIKDSLKREHQLGTIQLDFNLPERFKLRYKKTGVEQVVDEAVVEQVVDKAVEGQVDKAIEEQVVDKAVEEQVVEQVDKAVEEKSGEVVDEQADNSYGRPVMIHRAILGSIERFMAILLEHTSGRMPFWLSPRQICVIPITASNVPYAKKVCDHFKDYHIDIDESSETLNKKIRKAEKLKYNYIFVVGKKEKDAGSINIRINKKVLGTRSIDEGIELLCVDYNKRNSLY